MADLSGHPYIEVEIEKSGTLHDRGDLERAQTFVTQNEVTDLVVISHGWNNNTDEARKLYRRLFESVKAVRSGGSVELGDRRLGVLGILWPSKKFTDEDLIPGGGAVSFGGQSDAVVLTRLSAFADALDDPGSAARIAKVRAAIQDLDTSVAARDLFATTIRDLMPRGHADSDDGSDLFFDLDSRDLFKRLEAPLLPQSPSGAGGAAGGVMGAVGQGGGAAGLGDWFQGAKAAARRILNYATYYIMKSRAGDVGAGGVREVVAAVKQGAPDVKVHLVGHSFGGRVVTAAAKTLGDGELAKPSSMCLLQAAFSHNGFAQDFLPGKNGFFRSVAQNRVVTGPVLVTHTHHDRANGLAYPLASRLARQDAAAVGGPEDRFGAIGANGALHTPEAHDGTLLRVGQPGYTFAAGKFYNLSSDAFVADHGDVTGKEVAYAILKAIAST